MVYSIHVFGCSTSEKATQAPKSIPPRTSRVMQNCWVWKTKPQDLPQSPINSLPYMRKEKLRQLGYSQETGSYFEIKPESLFPAKHTEFGPYIQTKNTFVVLSKKNQTVNQKCVALVKEESPQKPFVSPKLKIKRVPPRWYRISKQGKSKPWYYDV